MQGRKERREGEKEKGKKKGRKEKWKQRRLNFFSSNSIWTMSLAVINIYSQCIYFIDSTCWLCSCMPIWMKKEVLNESLLQNSYAIYLYAHQWYQVLKTYLVYHRIKWV